jgi:hypothetical protein
MIPERPLTCKNKQKHNAPTQETGIPGVNAMTREPEQPKSLLATLAGLSPIREEFSPIEELKPEPVKI